MSNHDSHQDRSLPSRRLARFGGQSAPLSTSGTGRQILYRCPICRHPWLQDGTLGHLRLSVDQVRAKAVSLAADLDRLPPMVCRLCLFQAGGSHFQVDEYRSADLVVGYGFDWEHASGMHLQAAIRGASTLADRVGPADVPRQDDAVQAVLAWLAALLGGGEEMHLFSPSENALLNQNTLAGEGRGWKALSLVAECPPLADLAVVVLSTAVPHKEPLDPQVLLALWQHLAQVVSEHRTSEQTGQ